MNAEFKFLPTFFREYINDLYHEIKVQQRVLNLSRSKVETARRIAFNSFEETNDESRNNSKEVFQQNEEMALHQTILLMKHYNALKIADVMVKRHKSDDSLYGGEVMKAFFEEMLAHYENKEEYEKCAAIHFFMNCD